MTLDDQIGKGHAAERILGDPLVREAFQGIESGIVGAMRQCKLGDTKTQHELIVMLQLLTRFRGVFENHIQTGKLARLEKETLAQRMKNRLRRVR